MRQPFLRNWQGYDIITDYEKISSPDYSVDHNIHSSIGFNEFFYE